MDREAVSAAWIIAALMLAPVIVFVLGGRVRAIWSTHREKIIVVAAAACAALVLWNAPFTFRGANGIRYACKPSLVYQPPTYRDAALCSLDIEQLVVRLSLIAAGAAAAIYLTRK